MQTLRLNKTTIWGRLPAFLFCAAVLLSATPRVFAQTDDPLVARRTAAELLELAVVAGGVMGDPRGLDEIAPLIDERTLVILLLGSLVDPVEQVRRSAADDERIV